MNNPNTKGFHPLEEEKQHMNCDNRCNKDAVIEELREQVKDHQKRLTIIERDNSVNALRFEQIMKICEENKRELAELNKKPNRLVQTFINAFITATVAGVVSFLGYLLMKQKGVQFLDIKEYEKALELTQEVMDKISERKLKDDRNSKRKEKLLYFCLISNIVMAIFLTSITGFFIYFISNFDIEAVQETITIEGSDAQYNNIKGNNNSINTGGSN